MNEGGWSVKMEKEQISHAPRTFGWREKIRGKELWLFCIFSLFLLLAAALMMDSPKQIFLGMEKILLSRDALITDYFKLANYGAGFFNTFLVAVLALLLVRVMKVPFTGLTMAALFINIGYGLWGKNPVNMIPILLGTWAYALLHKSSLSNYVYTALFGTCLGPFVTEMVHILPFSNRTNMIYAVLLGIMMGYVLVPLSMRTAGMHQGYTLFNVGFSGGIVAFVVMCVMRSYGMDGEPVLIWTEGVHPWLLAGTVGYFLLTILYGWLVCGGSWKGVLHIMRHPGRAVADFAVMDGPGATLMNMGLVGLMELGYILLIGGDLSGPVLGAIFTAFGFAAFGAHMRNTLPVLLGVFVSALLSDYMITTPGVQLAAVFAVGLAPVAGQFGVIAGLIAGMLHSAVAMCTGSFYGGLNLYNNGFSTGWVAIVMVPLCESFISQYRIHKRRKGI